VKIYAQYAQVPERLAIHIRDEFMPKAAMTPDRVSGVAAITKDAIDFKFMQAPLTQAQLTELIQIPPPRN
jgi:NitT/TauT family transport system substrate-binding protein